MIIQIRGTNGSGKSTVMREVMAAYGGQTEILAVLPGRKKESLVGYHLFSKPLRECAVMGSYKNECGGIDKPKHSM